MYRERGERDDFHQNKNQGHRNQNYHNNNTPDIGAHVSYVPKGSPNKVSIRRVKSN